jgi:Flp pilus assembly protein TadB
MLALVAAVAGALAPRLYLSARLRARQRQALREPPLFLDLLRVAVEAGQGVDAAPLHVAPHLSGPLGEEGIGLLVVPKPAPPGTGVMQQPRRRADTVCLRAS